MHEPHKNGAKFWTPINMLTWSEFSFYLDSNKFKNHDEEEQTLKSEIIHSKTANNI